MVLSADPLAVEPLANSDLVVDMTMTEAEVAFGLGTGGPR